MMDDADLAELRMLRARAYGPSADLGADPAALRRLTELEALARGGGASRGPTAGPSHPGPPPPLPPDLRPARRETSVVAAGGGVAAASMPRRPVAPRRWHLSRGFAVLWLVSLVAVAALAAGSAWAAAWVAPVPRSGPAHQIATLEPDPEFVWPAGWPEDGDGAGFTFHGMSILSVGADIVGGRATGRCLFAYATEAMTAEGSLNGPGYSGCDAGAFPATAQFTIDDSLPQDLRDAVGDGTSVQFVLDGDRLGVFADDGAANATSPADPADAADRSATD